MDSSLREKTNELNKQVENVKRDMTKEEERIHHQHDQLEALLDTAHNAQEVPTGMISQNVISQKYESYSVLLRRRGAVD